MTHHYRVVIIPLDEDGIERHEVKRGEFVIYPGQVMTLRPEEIAVGVVIT